jgi:glycosyltransferase involved in cell wall biosynthesis
MKIFLDCTFLKNTRTGVDFAFLNLIENVFYQDSLNAYTILVNTSYNTQPLLKALGESKNYKIKKIYSRLPLQILYSCFLMPFYLRYNKFDVYHNPFFFGPLLRFICPDTKVVITVYDMYYRTVPKMMGKYLSTLFKIFAEPAIKKADKIIVISKQTADDVIHFTNIQPSKVILIYLALVNNFERKELIPTNLTKFDLQNGKYILTVGTLLPSKGVDDLIRSFAILVKKYNYHDIKLVSAGMHVGNYVDEIKQLIESLNLDDGSIKLLGYVDDTDINSLYASAMVYVSPSHYEGFGLTILEAMKHGIPVIARNASSLIEVVSDAGLLFNNNNELVEQMHMIQSDNTLRNKLIIKGYQRLKDFSWDVTAEKTLDVYKN